MTPHECLRKDKFDDIDKQFDEVKDGGEKRWDAIGKKVSWTAFTFVVVILMGIWMATQAAIWLEVKSVGQSVIKMDKKMAVHIGKEFSGHEDK